MSIKLIARAFEIKVGNPTRKLVLVKLADNASDDGLAWPKISTIAAQCECSTKSVGRHIKHLEQMGLLTIEHTFIRGMQANSKYHLHLYNKAGTESPSENKAGTESLTRRDTESHPQGQRVLPARTESPTEPSIESSIESSIEPSINILSDITEVFDYWVDVFKKSKSTLLSTKRKQRIEQRLKEGYTVEQLKCAILGCSNSDYHTENGYTDIELICRAPEKVDRFIELNRPKPADVAKRSLDDITMQMMQEHNNDTVRLIG